jgi:hypothetical protein
VLEEWPPRDEVWQERLGGGGSVSWLWETLLQRSIVASPPIFTVATCIDGHCSRVILRQQVGRIVVTSDSTSASRKNSSHGHTDISVPVAAIF